MGETNPVRLHSSVVSHIQIDEISMRHDLLVIKIMLVPNYHDGPLFSVADHQVTSYS